MRVTLFLSCFFTIASAYGQHPIDGTTLTFTVDKGSITVRVGPWSLTTRKTAELDRFVNAHFRAIDPSKIIVYGDSAARYPTFAPVIEVLKKHDWLNFSLQPINSKPKSVPASPRARG